MNSRIKFVVMTSSTCLVTLLLWGAVAGRSATTPEDTYRHLAVYSEVLSRIKSDYVEEPDMKNVTVGALNGLLESVDPYASYLSPEQYKQYQKSKDSQKGEVGLVLSKKFGYVGVVDAIPGSSAGKAGLGTGDFIETINGVSTRDMPLAFAELLLRGAPGSSVEISVMRLRRSEPQKITLAREVLKYPAINAKMLDGQVGHVQVESLEAGKTKQIAAAVAQLEKQGAQKIILDLRNNAAGNTEEGIAVANLFLDKGLITYLQGQKHQRRDFTADAQGAIYREPLVVITNRGTAGGAELAAAALLGNKRAEVVGERTYGDAAVRKTVPMDDGSAVVLSVAKYYSPDGKAIQDTGVTPTVAVAEMEVAAEAPGEEAPQTQPETKPEEDLLLKRALEVATKGAPPASSETAAPAAVDPQGGIPPRDLPPDSRPEEKK
ncbi:MAG: carboxyl-terminal protease [Bryobacteraceae bacterium]|nr:carboxyl-terminal protease [Bryobacteraceae bacterium]